MKPNVFNLLRQWFDKKFSHEEDRVLKLNHSKEEMAFYERVQHAARPLNDQEFEPFFAERVMHRIQTKTVAVQDLFFDSLKAQFQPLAIATGAIMILLMTYNMYQERAFSVSHLLPKTNLTYEEVMDPSLVYLGE